MWQITLAVGKLLQSGRHPKICFVSSFSGVSRSGGSPPSKPHVEGHLLPRAGTVQHHSPSVMMVPKEIRSGTPPTANACVLVEDRIWLMLVWIWFKWFAQRLSANISSPLCNSFFEVSKHQKDIYQRDVTLSFQSTPWNHELTKWQRVYSVPKAIHLHELY